MSAQIIPLPTPQGRPVGALSAGTAYRAMRLYEAAIELGFRAEVHTALGAYVRAQRCRCAVSRLRRLAFGCLLTGLSRDEVEDFVHRVIKFK